MDPRTRLEYALFQLTPTRTRCDLVIFCGGANEKLASGLLEPFLLHLKAAADQISKGGYSITLRPRSSDAFWFTKATLQRFVRFVNTPEVLERFVTTEKEIVQIEISNNAAETEAGDGNAKRAKSKDESGGTDEAEPEENHRARLQRVLETRKAVLRKEQAMAYARALVAGFEPVFVDDLISFADAFGASRLREACINFMELCNKKNEDRLWMAELAAMRASQAELSYLKTSGIVLAGEEIDPTQNLSINVPNGKQNSSSDGTMSDLNNQDGTLPTSAQIPMAWPNHLPPQYMHNFQGSMYQHMPPYQGFPYPGMHTPPPYYPRNMQWSPNMEESGAESDGRPSHRSSSRNKKKGSNKKESSEQDGSTEPSDSSESESEYVKKQKKKQGKKSSRKVVIRNINYITSRREGEKGSYSENSSDDVKEAVGSLGKKQQDGSKNPDAQNWDAFQNLLMRDEPSHESQAVEIKEEYFASKSSEEEQVNKHRAVSKDNSFVVMERPAGNGHDYARAGNFEADMSLAPMIKKTNGMNEEFLFSQRAGESRNYSNVTVSDATESSMVNRKDVVVDDSFMIQARSMVSDRSDSRVRTDIMDSDIIGASLHGTPEISQDVSKAFHVQEPEDLYMILDRNSATGHNVARTPEMDYESNVSFIDARTKKPDPETGVEDGQLPNGTESKPKSNGVPGRKSKPVNGKSKPDIMSRTRRSPMGSKNIVHKSKFEMEEENRKKKEELMIQRQKRIAERSAASGKTATLAKQEKPKTQSPSSEAKKAHKPVLRSSTIDRLAAARTPITHSKPDQPKKAILKPNGAGNKNLSLKKNEVQMNPQKEVQCEDPSPNPESLKVDDMSLFKVAPVLCEDTVDAISEKLPVSGLPEGSTPASDGMSRDPMHSSRKKWDDEDPSIAAKEFRKLLLFGRN